MRLHDWWESGQFIELEGHRIFTRSAGSGPTLVILHGFPTSSHDWTEVITDLSQDYRCIAFDYLGYGASDKPKDADYSSLVQTDRALAILDRLGVEQATVIAHDLGGILLQQLLHRAAQGQSALQITQAIFCNSSVYAELYKPTPMQVALVDPAQGKLLARQISHEGLSAAFAAMFPAHPLEPEQIDDIWTAISREDGQHLWPQHLVYMAERAAAGAAWVDTMRRTTTPLGFIYGLADPISGAQIIAQAEKDLQGARCIGLPGLGHYPQLESPTAFTTALRTLLQKAPQSA